MDGVIIDSEPLYRKIQDSVFAGLGFSVQDAEYDTFIGLGLKIMWEKLIASRQLIQSNDTLIELNNRQIYEFFRNEEYLEPMPGFVAFMDYCMMKNLKIAVASSTAKRVIEIILKKIGVLDKFPIIVSGEEVKTGKPAPDIFLEAAGRMKLSPVNCLVIEDSENGVKAAKSAQMFCVGLQNPHSGNQDLSTADMIVKKFDEIKLGHLL